MGDWAGSCEHIDVGLCDSCTGFVNRLLDTPEKIAELKSRSDEADAIMRVRSENPDSAKEET